MLFWILCAVLTAGVIFALARPLVTERTGAGESDPDLEVYRDQLGEIDRDMARGLLSGTEAEAARIEVARRMLAAAERAQAQTAEPAPARYRSAQIALYGIAAGIPIAALSFYLALGSPGLPGAPAGERLAGADAAAAKVEALVAEVEARLRESPGDGRGWDVIAPVYMHLGRYRDAANAYARAIDLEGETAVRLLGFGEATVT
ncbi:MAG TPA: c-type cytochrome biogenesis protein CcmI, partial [Hyphomicrobiaceae bacterium]|nr:c-type cytochrome biogenesis protein CcmI [Hyphomicrobiaceae bacterium]